MATREEEQQRKVAALQETDTALVKTALGEAQTMGRVMAEQKAPNPQATLPLALADSPKSEMQKLTEELEASRAQLVFLARQLELKSVKEVRQNEVNKSCI